MHCSTSAVIWSTSFRMLASATLGTIGSRRILLVSYRFFFSFCFRLLLRLGWSQFGQSRLALCCLCCTRLYTITPIVRSNATFIMFAFAVL